MTPSCGLKKKDQMIYAQISDCFVHMVYLLLLLYCGALIVSFRCLGDVFDSVSLLLFATFAVTTFGRIYNLAQILI